ncbi:MAG TPA: GNAT family N-acetyltransferase, partial [bacterium]|nr:GNAT family N-acetyltransferase [bacterium]
PMDFSNYKNFDPFAEHEKDAIKKSPNDMSKELIRFVYYLLINNDKNVVYLLDTDGFNNDRNLLLLIDYIKKLTSINDDKELFKFILGHYNSTENKKGMWDISEIWFRLLEKHYFHNIRKLDSYDITKPNGADCINFSYEEDILASLYIKRVDIYPYIIGHVVGPKDIDKVIEMSIRRHDSFTEDLKKIKEDQINSLLELKRATEDEKLLKKIDKLLSYYDDGILPYSSQQKKHQKDLDAMKEENWTYLERQVKREEILIQGKQNPQLYDPKFLEEVRLDYVMDVLEYNENIEINDIMYMYDLDELFKLVDNKTTISITMEYGLKYRGQPVHELLVTEIEIIKVRNDSAWASKDMFILYGKVNGGRRRPLSWLFYTMYTPDILYIDFVYTLPELRGQHLGEALYNKLFLEHKEVGMVEAILGMENHSEFYKYLGQKMGDETMSELETIGDEETHEIIINAKTDKEHSVASVVIEAINSTPLGKHNSKIGF